MFQHPDPLVVEVTDGNGNPISGAAVVWSVVGGGAFFFENGSAINTITTFTGGNGQTSAQIGQPQSFDTNGQYGTMSTITAASGTAAATFYETQAAGLNPGPNTIDIYPSWANTPQDSTITGLENSAGPSFPMGVYTALGVGVPNVAVFLANSAGSDVNGNPIFTLGPSTTVPSAYCETQLGAGQYTALTNSAGVATCNVMFGPVAGSGTYTLVTGGAQATSVSVPDGNWNTGLWPFVVTAPTVGGVRVFSGNPQSGLAGQTLQPLVAEVVDTTSKPLAGQTVKWAATPASYIQLNSATTTSDVNGLVEQASPVLTASATGTITVTATSSINADAVATFTINATQPITVGSFAIQGGNNQTAVEGAAFTNQLAVIVIGSNGLPVNNATVSFAPSGPVTLSATSATTNSTGVTEVAATAGITAGPATVTASIGGLVQVFSLTVVPPGPNLAVSSFVNGADGQVGSISPCGIAAIVGTGVAVGGSGLPPMVGPLSYEVATDTISFGTGSSAISAPIFSVSNVAGQQQIVFLVPCEVTPGTQPVTVTVEGGSQTLSLNVLPASPGIFQTTQSDGVVRAVIERPDGTFASPTNPARRGETDTAFVTGLGPVSPQVATNALPIPETPSAVNGTVVVGINNSAVPLTAAQLSPDMLGVYTVQFVVPTNAPQNNDVVFSVGLIPAGATQTYYSNSSGSKIPID
jgi:uncharacterized protein (TIGR03437 family)